MSVMKLELVGRHDAPVSHLQLLADGRILSVAGSEIRVWDPDGKAPTLELNADTSEIDWICPAPDLSWIALEGTTGLQAVHVASGRIARGSGRRSTCGAPNAFVDPDRALGGFFTGDDMGWLRAWTLREDANTGLTLDDHDLMRIELEDPVTPLPPQDEDERRDPWPWAQIVAMATPRGAKPRYLYLATNDGRLLRLDAREQRLDEDPPRLTEKGDLAYGPHVAMILSADNKLLCYAPDRTSLRLFQRSDGRFLRHIDFNTQMLAFAHVTDISLIAGATDTQEVTLFTLTSNDVFARWEPGCEVGALCPGPRPGTFVAGCADGQVLLVEAMSEAEIHAARNPPPAWQRWLLPIGVLVVLAGGAWYLFG